MRERRLLWTPELKNSTPTLDTSAETAGPGFSMALKHVRCPPAAPAPGPGLELLVWSDALRFPREVSTKAHSNLVSKLGQGTTQAKPTPRRGNTGGPPRYSRSLCAPKGFL